MATRSKLPLARLSAITRKRLFRIISGEDYTHPEPKRSTAAECKHYFGLFRSQESENNPLINTTRTFTQSASSSAIDRRESKRRKLDNVSCHNFSDSGCKINGEKVHDRMYSESKQGEASDRKCQRVNHTTREENLPRKRRARAFRRFMRAIACTGRGELEGADETAGHLSLTKTQHLKETEVVLVEGSTSSWGGFTPDQEKSQSEHKQEVDKENNKNGCQLKLDVYCNVDCDTVNIKEKTSCTTQNNHSSTCQNISKSGEGELEVEPLPEIYKTDSVTSKEMGFSTMATTSYNKDVELTASIDQKEFQPCRMLKQSISSSKGFDEFDEDYGLNNLFDQKISNVKSRAEKNDNENDKTKRRRKPKRRGKRGKMESGLERETESKNEESGRITNKINNKNKNGRPNYFLSIRVDDSVIHENVKKFHEHILKEEAALKPVLISLPSLHLTLFVMRLEDEAEISKAKEALQGSKKVIQKFFHNCLSELNFKGLETFGNKVIYLGLDKKEENQSLASLNEAVNILCESYSDLGIELDKNAKEKFVPHVTVIKLSKNVKKMKQKGIKRINEKLLEDFLTCEFGSQKITEILLCSMLDQKEKDGFYKVIDRIPLASEIDVNEMNEKSSDGSERDLLSDDKQ